MTDSIHRFRLRLHRPKLGRWAARGAFAATIPVVCEHPGDRGIQVSPDPARPAMVGGEQPTGARLRGGERWRRSFGRWQVGRWTAVLTLLAGCTSASAPGPSGPAAPPDFFTAAAFTGQLVLVWGGPRSGAFDPVANRWLAVPVPPREFLPTEGVWTGTALLFVHPDKGRVDAVAWRPGTPAWMRLPSVALQLTTKDSPLLVAVPGGASVFDALGTGPGVTLDLARRLWHSTVTDPYLGGPSSNMAADGGNDHRIEQIATDPSPSCATDCRLLTLPSGAARRLPPKSSRPWSSTAPR